MNREQIAMAVNAGLELLGPDSNVQIPARLNDGVFFLRQFLAGVAQGRLGIDPTVGDDSKPVKEGAKPTEPPLEGNRQQRRAVAKKKRSKKKT